MIPSDENLVSLRNIEDIDDGSKAIILELIVYPLDSRHIVHARLVKSNLEASEV